MAFQIFYIFINVSVIAAPLVSGTLGQNVGWHYGFGCAGVVMVLGLIIYLSGRRHLPKDDKEAPAADSGAIVAAFVGIPALIFVWLAIAEVLFASWVQGVLVSDAAERSTSS